MLNRNRITWPILITSVLYFGSATRGPAVPVQLTFIGYDKVGHLCVFGLLAVAWLRCFREANYTMRCAVIAATIVMATGVIDEWIQSLNPRRTYDPADMLADFVGAWLGVLSYRWLPWLQCWLERDARKGFRKPQAAAPNDAVVANC